MNNRAIIQKVKKAFDEDFSKKNYMEERTCDTKHLDKILACLNIKAQSNILDLGTGSGFLAFPIAEMNTECSVYGLDIATKTLEKNKEKATMMNLNNLHFKEYDGVKFPFKDNMFDCVVTRYALHHFPDIDKSFSEISRVLKKGGSMFISDPTADLTDKDRFIDRFMQMKEDGHVRFYLKSEFMELADKHGFQPAAMFDSNIRFPSERTEKYLQISESIDKEVIRNYDIEVMNGKVFITLQVMNLLFVKSR